MLDRLATEDPYVKHLLRSMRAGRGRRLDAAVEELIADFDFDEGLVRAAADRVRAQMQAVVTAKEPRTIAPGGKESWYPGASAEDPDWGTLLSILRGDGWGDEPIEQLDTASTKVLAHMPDPLSPASFHSVGLVLGYVQSGKTTNFTSVIAKAADAGYRLFIVLSGIHNGLRLQTQDRLNDQLWERNRTRWHRLTDENDFVMTPNVDAVLSADQSTLAVVKKNGARLRALRRWLMGARPDVLARCPIMIIDDEADQASVNTAKPDRNPTTINRLVRGLVYDLPKVAYVGYTATPFANVLIEPGNDDLYPSDFIIDLPRPESYIGPEAVFGREPLQFDPDGEMEPGHDFIRSVPDSELAELRPRGAASRADFSPQVTPSLGSALRYFLLSTAARRARGRGNRHSTALVHSSQYTDAHRKTADVIRVELRRLRDALVAKDAGLLDELRGQWDDEVDAVPASDFGLEPVAWDELVVHLPAVATDVEVIVDNSLSNERLNYPSDRGRVIVAVGGNTLSRGLTLEGLSVSFFVRTASAYDTLLQMGRWFGYRSGYGDLTRIWLPDDMRGWFHHLATVEAEIRSDIARYDTEHLTPQDFGPRIRTHPTLAITAASKMRAATDAEVSYSGRRIQTILFNHRDHEWLGGNLAAARSLIERVADAPRAVPPASGKLGVTIIGPVPSAEIVRFVQEYRFHENSRDLNSKTIARYLTERAAAGDLTHFRIAVMGRHPEVERLGSIELGVGRPVAAINRARLQVIGGRDYADIKALMSRSDRAIDLNISDEALGNLTEGQIAKMRNVPGEGGHGDGTGLLALYPISRWSAPTRDARTRDPLNAVDDVIGVGLVFPFSAAVATVSYKTADLSSLVLETPGDEDELDEPEGVAEASV